MGRPIPKSSDHYDQMLLHKTKDIVYKVLSRVESSGAGDSECLSYEAFIEHLDPDSKIANRVYEALVRDASGRYSRNRNKAPYSLGTNPRIVSSLLRLNRAERARDAPEVPSVVMTEEVDPNDNQVVSDSNTSEGSIVDVPGSASEVRDSAYPGLYGGVDLRQEHIHP